MSARRGFFVALVGAGLLLVGQAAAPPFRPPGDIQHVANEDVAAHVARTGEWEGRPAKLVTVLGVRRQGWDSTSALGDVSEYLDTSVRLNTRADAGTAYYLRSTSADDDADDAGTGARSVHVVYLDAAGNEQTLVANLNGTTPVPVDAGFAAVQSMEVASLGSGDTAAGDIAFSSSSGAPTPAETVEFVGAGGNRSRSGRYMVPAGWEAHVMDWSTSGTGNGTFDVRLRAEVFEHDGSLSDVFHFLSTAFLNANAGHDEDMHGKLIPSGARIKVSAIPSSAGAGNRLDTTVHLVLLRNAR